MARARWTSSRASYQKRFGAAASSLAARASRQATVWLNLYRFSLLSSRSRTTRLVTGPCLGCRFPALTRLWETAAFLGVYPQTKRKRPPEKFSSGYQFPSLDERM